MLREIRSVTQRLHQTALGPHTRSMRRPSSTLQLDGTSIGSETLHWRSNAALSAFCLTLPAARSGTVAISPIVTHDHFVARHALANTLNIFNVHRQHQRKVVAAFDCGSPSAARAKVARRSDRSGASFQALTSAAAVAANRKLHNYAPIAAHVLVRPSSDRRARRAWRASGRTEGDQARAAGSRWCDPVHQCVPVCDRCMSLMPDFIRAYRTSSRKIRRRR